MTLKTGLPRPPQRRSHRFDYDAQERFLRSIENQGRITVAAEAVGVSAECAREYIRSDREGFAERFNEAMQVFRDKIEEEIHRRAMEGVDEPIIGGKDRDEVVAHVRRYSDRLLEFYAKRHIPEYRERGQLDVNVSGGVMVVPARPATPSDWATQYESLERPTDVEVLPPASDPVPPTSDAQETP